MGYRLLSGIKNGFVLKFSLFFFICDIDTWPKLHVRLYILRVGMVPRQYIAEFGRCIIGSVHGHYIIHFGRRIAQNSHLYREMSGTSLKLLINTESWATYHRPLWVIYGWQWSIHCPTTSETLSCHFLTGFEWSIATFHLKSVIFPLINWE